MRKQWPPAVRGLSSRPSSAAWSMRTGTISPDGCRMDMFQVPEASGTGSPKRSIAPGSNRTSKSSPVRVIGSW
ncbi:hypothetical protein ACFSTC_05760 [Nonomuraea ferruginea]